MGHLIVDADILIDALRGYEAANTFLASHQSQIWLSVITITELYAGVRSKNEQSAIRDLCSRFAVVPMDEAIAVKAGLYRSTVGRSHGASLGDCVLAATADYHNFRLVTLNKKHYPMLDNVFVPYRKSAKS